MPTVGWIFERDEERYLGSRETRTTPLPPPVFRCSRCGVKLANADELRIHFHVKHPLELPALHIRGEPLLRESVVRLPLSVDDVELIQCSHCEVQMDGGPWKRLAVPEFRKRFTSPTDAMWNVRLIHERSTDNATAEEQYHVRFRIPANAALNAVDELFIRTLVLDAVQQTDLEDFEAGLPSSAAAREYAAALGNYTLAILIKEQRTPLYAPVGFERFAELMKEALEVLRLFYRPVALAVCSSIRFNLNDFTDHGAGGAAEIDTGLRFFRHIMSQGEPKTRVDSNERSSKVGSKLAICPIDKVTDWLLAACAALKEGAKLSPAELQIFRQLTRGKLPVSEQDLGKIHVLGAEGYLRLAQVAEAIPHLRAIQFVRPFKDWAQRQLDSISQNGT